MSTEFLSGNLEGRNHLEEPGVDDRIILQCTVEGNMMGWCGLDSPGSFEHGNKL
jgi:hypothetical protein